MVKPGSPLREVTPTKVRRRPGVHAGGLTCTSVPASEHPDDEATPSTGAVDEGVIGDSRPPIGLNQGDALRLLLANRTMLLAYINVITGDPTLTEDVFQEVSIVVMEKFAMVENSDGFRPWARTIARFQSLKAVNKRRANRVVLASEAIDRLDQAWEERDRDDPRAASVAALERCIGKLTPRARQLVQLRYHQELSGQDIADRLRKPLNTIYVAISRIHRTLADCVRNELSGARHAE